MDNLFMFSNDCDLYIRGAYEKLNLNKKSYIKRIFAVAGTWRRIVAP